MATQGASLGSQPMATPGEALLRQTPLGWFIPAFMRVAIALVLALAAIKTLCDSRILEPLVDCLTQH